MKKGFLRIVLFAFLPVAAVLAIAAGTESADFAAHAQAPNRAPMTLSGLVEALRKGIGVLPTSEFVQTIQRRGVSFQVTASVEQQLRRAGATSDILQAVRSNFRGARAPEPAAGASARYTAPPSPPASASPAQTFSQAKLLTMPTASRKQLP